jgi:hypothetical protein
MIKQFGGDKTVSVMPKITGRKQVDAFNWQVWNSTRMVRINGHAGQFTATAYVNNGETATTRSTTVKTLAGAFRWAEKWLRLI